MIQQSDSAVKFLGGVTLFFFCCEAYSVLCSVGHLLGVNQFN